MGYVFLAGIVVVAALAAYQSISRLRKPTRLKLLRWTLSGVAALLTVFLALARRFELAAFTGLAAVSVFRRGRLGPFTLGSESVSPGNISKVRSHYVAMELDHDSNEISGSVIAGQFAGADLIDLDETDTRALIAEIGGDPESLSLLESWLDANRAGWREYFEQKDETGNAPVFGEHAEAEAYAVLGVKPGASADDVRAAHRELMKAVHPDRGGSGYLAAKINEARDLLLKKLNDTD